jgi:hypothetical protein
MYKPKFIVVASVARHKSICQYGLQQTALSVPPITLSFTEKIPTCADLMLGYETKIFMNAESVKNLK